MLNDLLTDTARHDLLEIFEKRLGDTATRRREAVEGDLLAGFPDHIVKNLGVNYDGTGPEVAVSLFLAIDGVDRYTVVGALKRKQILSRLHAKSDVTTQEFLRPVILQIELWSKLSNYEFDFQQVSASFPSDIELIDLRGYGQKQALCRFLCIACSKRIEDAPWFYVYVSALLSTNTDSQNQPTIDQAIAKVGEALGLQTAWDEVKSQPLSRWLNQPKPVNIDPNKPQTPVIAVDVKCDGDECKLQVQYYIPGMDCLKPLQPEKDRHKFTASLKSLAWLGESDVREPSQTDVDLRAWLAGELQRVTNYIADNCPGMAIRIDFYLPVSHLLLPVHIWPVTLLPTGTTESIGQNHPVVVRCREVSDNPAFREQVRQKANRKPFCIRSYELPSPPGVIYQQLKWDEKCCCVTLNGHPTQDDISDVMNAYIPFGMWLSKPGVRKTSIRKAIKTSTSDIELSREVLLEKVFKSRITASSTYSHLALLYEDPSLFLHPFKSQIPGRL